jgi:hypothetical protein
VYVAARGGELCGGETLWFSLRSLNSGRSAGRRPVVSGHDSASVRENGNVGVVVVLGVLGDVVSGRVVGRVATDCESTAQRVSRRSSRVVPELGPCARRAKSRARARRSTADSRGSKSKALPQATPFNRAESKANTTHCSANPLAGKRGHSRRASWTGRRGSRGRQSQSSPTCCMRARSDMVNGP